MSYDAGSNLSELALNVEGGTNPDFMMQLAGPAHVASDFIA
ncbi:hypothetical protein EPYR_03852 [Erwinia pyrifoliae DSM 12163]|nr:hypothetical protein EPYR_03852 [Erwinia pyrifoliae DSM 12163]